MNKAVVFGLASAVFGMLSAGEKVSVGLAGDVSLERGQVEISPRLYDKSWGACRSKGGWKPGADGSYASELCDKDGPVVGVVARHTFEDGKAVLRWRFDARRDWEGSALAINLELPTSVFCGGSVFLGDKEFSLPAAKSEKPWLGGSTCRQIRVRDAKGRELALSLSSAPWASLQDNREWKMEDFSLRIPVGDKKLAAGEIRTIEIRLAAADGVDSVASGPVTIAAGGEWIPLRDTTDVIPGSALDFSKLGWMDAPAGKYGRVVAKGADFEFEKKPGVPQRFYGCNLCFTANFLSEDEANALCSRMARLGYNALRIHHYERGLCDSKDGTTIRPDSMAMLDNLLNACIANGIYLTTDLFVSRAVPWRSIGVDRDGEIPMDQYKELVLFDEGAYGNYLAFSRALLGHVNPKTGRRWADEPALAFLALINEGNLGNHGYGFMAGQPKLQATTATASCRASRSCWRSGGRGSRSAGPSPPRSTRTSPRSSPTTAGRTRARTAPSRSSSPTSRRSSATGCAGS